MLNSCFLQTSVEWIGPLEFWFITFWALRRAKGPCLSNDDYDWMDDISANFNFKFQIQILYMCHIFNGNANRYDCEACIGKDVQFNKKEERIRYITILIMTESSRDK